MPDGACSIVPVFRKWRQHSRECHRLFIGTNMHVLDRPVWESLATRHAALSEGGPLAKRYVRDVNLFASARDDSAEARDALAELVKPGEHVYVLQVPEDRKSVV